MKELEGRVAVITGAASGIGRAFAERFAAAGMKLVLADVEQKPLESLSARLREGGNEVEASLVDVRDAAAVEGLAERCEARFGGAHLLCNNAGVAAGGPMWEIPADEWDWVLGVNLVGVVNGVRSFVSRMLKAGEPAHVVNTASVAGLTCPSFMSPYNVTKHGVVALSETLLGELQTMGAPIGVSVLCPGWVRTRIHESDRNKPGDVPISAASDPNLAAMREMVGSLVAEGIEPEAVAEAVLDAVRNDHFWIRTHAEMEGPSIRARCEAVMAREAPKPMLPTQIK